jgi:hypothetical protein
MSEYDDNIEFDFFDDETGEAPQPEEQPRRRRAPGGTPRPPQEHTGIPPTARLVGLIAFAILIIVLLVLWVQSCSGSGKKAAFKDYFGKVQVLAVDSNRLGQAFANELTTPGIKAAALAGKIDGFATQQQRGLDQASQLKSPSDLRAAQEDLVDALQFRVSGLRGLAVALRNGAGSTQVQDTAAQLANQSQRLVTSDVIWKDHFRDSAVSIMQQRGITGLAPPSSRFITASGVDSPAFWLPVLQRLNTNQTGNNNTGGAIGTKLVGVTWLPAGKPLSTTQENTVVAGTDLGFDVTVENSGDSQLVQINVTLTIQQSSPITSTRKIPIINPGEKKVVRFTNLGTPSFATSTQLKVVVEAVKNETNPDNNSASYPVIFSLG